MGISEEQARRAIESFDDDGPRERRALAARRFRILSERHDELVMEQIGIKFNEPDTVAEMRKWLDLSNNPALDIVRDIAVAWKHGVMRTVTDATEDQLKALHELILESDLDTHVQEWNRLAFFCGPVSVMPEVVDGRVQWQTLLPHAYEVIENPLAPQGAPLAAIYKIAERGESPDFVIVDDKAVSMYSSAANKILGSEPHNAGEYPFCTLRLDRCYATGWWGNQHRHRRLEDGTLMVSVLMSSFGFVRKTQNRKLLALIGELDKVPKGQVLDPETGLNLDTGRDGPGSLRLDSLDFDTHPDGFMKHIDWIREQLAKSYGGHIDPGSRRITFPHGSLNELRNEQLPYARRFENEIVRKLCKVARSNGHWLAAKLPSDDQLVNGFTADFGKLAKTFSDPMEEAEYVDWLISKGCSSQREVLRRLNPELSNEELDRLQDRLLDEQSYHNDKVAKRNLSMDQRQNVETAAQAFGRMGPEARDNPDKKEE